MQSQSTPFFTALIVYIATYYNRIYVYFAILSSLSPPLTLNFGWFLVNLSVHPVYPTVAAAASEEHTIKHNSIAPILPLLSMYSIAYT